MHISEFKTSLVYRASSRKTRDTQRYPVSKQTNNKQTPTKQKRHKEWIVNTAMTQRNELPLEAGAHWERKDNKLEFLNRDPIGWRQACQMGHTGLNTGQRKERPG